MKRGFKILNRKLLKPYFVFVVFFLVSCAPAKYVPKDKYLLNDNKVEIDSRSISKSEIENYILQKPNKKWILGIRLNLFFYNLSNVNKNNWFNNWLRKIGEEPVIYDPYLTNRSHEQLKKYLENKGYYFSQIIDTAKYRKGNSGRRNVIVTYSIKPNNPYYIRNITYLFEDTSLVPLIMQDTIHSLLKKNMLFDKEILQKERLRIENHLKDNGYFHFSKEYIYFDAKAVEDSFYIDLTMGIKEFVESDADKKSKIKYHPRYSINNVEIFTDYNPLNKNSPGIFDTTTYNDLNFLYSGKLKIKPSTISNYNYLMPGEIYRSNDVDKTYQNLTLLGIYKFVNIQFTEPEDQETDTFKYLPIDATIELTRKKVQSFQVEPLLTNSTGDIGIRGNVSYQNWNLFRGSEIFNLKLTGGIEVERDSLYSQVEYGAESRIELPRFWLPFRSEKFIKKYGPKTFISLSINHRTDERYVRTYATSAFGYTWKGNRYLRHSVFPIEMNFVQVDEGRSSDFIENSIKNPSYKFSFTDHFVGSSRYTVEYNTQEIGKIKDFFYFKMNLESAGNLLYGISKITGRTLHNGAYHFSNSPFSQYIKNDYDFRFFRVYNTKNSVGYRVFAGVEYPYGNSRTMPYEKRYFAGGAYSIRAWKAFALGPGSYKNNDTIQNEYDRYENIGDIKLEFNVEYRFKLFWKLEGALFADAGNIWEMNYDSTKVGSQFKWDKFYKEIAMGVGFGMRFDFSYFLIRLDLGMKIIDPSFPESERWLPFNHRYRREDFPIQFGIGYPF